MNKYGEIAQTHFQKHLPSRYAQITDPETHFAVLGEEVAQRVDELTTDLAGGDPPGEGFMEKLGRLNMAKLTAEGQALRELVLEDPEDEPESSPAA